MAIEIPLAKEQNDVKFPFQTAYLKISQVDIRAEHEEMWIYLNGYPSADSRNTAGACSIIKKTIVVPLNEITLTDFSKNGIKQAAYNWLKKQTRLCINKTSDVYIDMTQGIDLI